MSTLTINVVGSGIAGSLVARVLREKGYDVLVIDNSAIFSASRASSNLFINHWLKKFIATEADNGVKVLRRLFNEGQIEKPFAQGLGYAMSVEHIPQRHLLVEPDVKESVEQVVDDGVVMFDSRLLPGPTIVCVGHNTTKFRMRDPIIDINIKVGHCFLFRGKLEEGQSRIALVSPYTHEKLYQFDEDTIYYADSVAILPQTYWGDQNKFVDRTRARVEKYLGKGLMAKEFRIGYRPIMPNYPFGRLTRHDRRVWSLNGGGKNGMVAYAHHAEQFAEQVRHVI